MKKPVGAQRGFGAIAVIIALVFATVLVIGGALLYRYNRQESSYKNIISEFVTAMGNGDASKVASLESTRFQEWIHNDTEDHVVAGTKFAPCMHWGTYDRKECTWQYV